MKGLEDDFVQLARLALDQKHDDVRAFVRRAGRRFARTNPELARALGELTQKISRSVGRGAAGIEFPAPVPVDADSRLELVRREEPVILDHKPIFSADLRSTLDMVLAERRSERRLRDAGLAPTRSLLFTGSPGLGKTLAARWLASELGFPLLTLDLSAVMSSFLGRTGNNIRAVLDHARTIPCVMLLDEFDACAKRRDDATEIGELKRLVTVLLQAVDDWPETGLLVAATNHPDLLDPAVWRRFDHVLTFPAPGRAELVDAVGLFVGGQADVDGDWTKILAGVLEGSSFADVERTILGVRRKAAVANVPLTIFLEELVKTRVDAVTQKKRLEIALALDELGLSQRRVAEITGVSRDTIRKHKDESSTTRRS